MHKRVSKKSTSARQAHDPHGHRRQPGSRFHLDALCSEARRQSSLHDTCGPEAKLCRGKALPRLGRAASFVKSQSALRVLTRKTFLRVLALRHRLRKSGRRACKSARFKNAKEAKVLALRNRLRKSGRRACKKCSTQRTRTHRKYCHTELVYLVPQATGPPEYTCVLESDRFCHRYPPRS